MEVVKMAKLKKFEKPSMTVEDILSLGREYDEINSQLKVLNDRKKVLSDLIKEGAEKFGVKDDKGSYYLESDEFVLGKVAKKTMRLNQDKARETLESMGLGDTIDEVTTYVVNEDRLNQAVADKRITLDEVKSFTDIKTDYSVSVKVKAEVPEIEQSTLMAARKKK